MAVPKLDRLREAVATVRRQRNPKRRRYGVDLRREIVAYVAIKREGGASTKTLSESLGLPYATLCSWMPRKNERFRPVAVARPEPKATEDVFELVTVQGHRVVGLRRKDVAYLLRALV